MGDLQELTPQDLAAALKRGEVILVDVREASEFADTRIPAALNHPLSTFSPAALPHDAGRLLVLHCLKGGRSAKAAGLAAEAGTPPAAHLAGGIEGWIAAGLPYWRHDPDTGKMELDGGTPATA